MLGHQPYSASTFSDLGKTPTTHEGSAAVSAQAAGSASGARTFSVAANAVSATAAVSASARRVPLGSALINGASTTTVNSTANGSRVRESSGTSTATATASVSYIRERNTGGTSTCTGTTTATAYATRGAAGSTSAAASLSSAAKRVRESSGAISAAASTVGNSERIHQGLSEFFPFSAILARAVTNIAGAATVSAIATNSAAAGYVLKSASAISITSVTAVVGREKWEAISVTPFTWTKIAA